jgi:uncharacterized membrane protein YuzA (DUF378 family)
MRKARTFSHHLQKATNVMATTTTNTTNTTVNGESAATKLVKLALVLAIIGAINWGLVGFFNWNLVDAIFGGGTAEETSNASRVVYAIVGLAGLAALPLLKAVLPTRHHHTGMHSASR